MLVAYELKLDIENEENYRIYNWGSIMQGVLIENLDSNYIEKLHNQKYNPYSQYIFMRNNEYIWRINTLDDEAYEKILENNILKKDEIFLKQKNIKIRIKDKKLINKINIDDLFRKWFISDSDLNKVKYKINTPVSYKEDNQYQIIPCIDLILKNLINKWNAFSKNYLDKNIYEEYVKRVYISNYNIKSTVFYIERVKIKSYIGTIEISINANQMMKNILQMLFEFGEYAGLGIKTSMGMGGINRL